MLTKTLLLITTAAFVGISSNVNSANAKPSGDHWDNRFGIFAGNKRLDKDDFEDNNHGAFGLKFDLKKHSWPVSIAIDLMSSGEEKKVGNTKTERVTGGFHLGVRKRWQLNEHFESVVGGGLNFSTSERSVDVDGSLQKENDKDIGYWLSSSIAWKLESGFRLGAEVRYTDAEVTLFNDKINTGGIYSGLFVEYKF